MDLATIYDSQKWDFLFASPKNPTSLDPLRLGLFRTGLTTSPPSSSSVTAAALQQAAARGSVRASGGHSDPIDSFPRHRCAQKEASKWNALGLCSRSNSPSKIFDSPVMSSTSFLELLTEERASTEEGDPIWDRDRIGRRRREILRLC